LPESPEAARSRTWLERQNRTPHLVKRQCNGPGWLPQTNLAFGRCQTRYLPWPLPRTGDLLGTTASKVTNTCEPV
jgi:hypothetical protein